MKKILLSILFGQVLIMGNTFARNLIYPMKTKELKKVTINLITSNVIVYSDQKLKEVSISYDGLDQDARYELKGDTLSVTQFRDSSPSKTVKLSIPTNVKLKLTNIYGDIEVCGHAHDDLEIKIISGKIHLCEANKAKIVSIEGDVVIDSFVKDLDVTTKTANVDYKAMISEDSIGDNYFNLASGDLKTSLKEDLITKDLRSKTGNIIEKNKDIVFGRKVKLYFRSIHGNLEFVETL